MVNIILILSVIIHGLILCMVWVFIARPKMQMTKAYPLYAVRDNFVFLVASGKLKEEDPLFQEFYKSINIIIPNSKAITIRRLVESMEDARKKGYDPTDEEWIKEKAKQLKTANDEVRQAVFSFYEAMLLLMLQNSPVLWLGAKLHFAAIPRITKFQKTVGGLFDRVQYARTVVCHPC